MSREFRVAWVVDVDADSIEEAAAAALMVHRDGASIATVFNVCPKCACGEYHSEDIEVIDLDETAEVGYEH